MKTIAEAERPKRSGNTTLKRGPENRCEGENCARPLAITGIIIVLLCGFRFAGLLLAAGIVLLLGVVAWRVVEALWRSAGLGFGAICSFDQGAHASSKS